MKEHSNEIKNDAWFKSKKFVFFLIVIMVANLFGLFVSVGNIGGTLLIQNLPGQIAVACLQAVITAIITVFLLKAQTNEQTEAALKKERFAILFNKKSETYDSYLSDLVAVGNRGSITKEEFLKLVDDLNFKVGMYISEESNDAIAGQLEIIGSNRDTKTIKTCVYNIAQELKKDLQLG